jgi:predicted GH43/DUF377 family glycosyl hydrolase
MRLSPPSLAARGRSPGAPPTNARGSVDSVRYRAATVREPSYHGLLALLSIAVWTTGCTPYGNFRLPPPPAGPDVRFEWQVRPDPVLTRGPETWDGSDALNPSVVQFAGMFWNLYSGYDGHRWHTGVASSRDPFSWRKQGRILSPQAGSWEGDYIAANGSALVRAGRLWYWYQAGNPPRIGLATSGDGRGWTRSAGPVMETGPVGSWDERGIGDPYVIEAGRRLYLFYVGVDRARRQRLGVADSEDGEHWIKLRDNPALEMGEDSAFDEAGLGEPAVWASNGHYWMLYTGRNRVENRRIGLAESEDGVHWKRSSRAGVFAGDRPWDDKVVCDPSVLVAEGGVHVWFGGGNVAHPAERINGQIGYAFLRVLPR